MSRGSFSVVKLMGEVPYREALYYEALYRASFY